MKEVKLKSTSLKIPKSKFNIQNLAIAFQHSRPKEFESSKSLIQRDDISISNPKECAILDKVVDENSRNLKPLDRK